MLTNLLIILFCAINVDNYQVLKGLIIAIVVYSVTTLTLIYLSNQDSQAVIYLPTKIKFLITKKLGYGLVFVIIFTISCGIFYFCYTHKNQVQQNNNSRLEQTIYPTDVSIDVSAIKPLNKTLLEKKDHQPNLQNNILLRGFSDVILIIVGVMMVVLLKGKIKSI